VKTEATRWGIVLLAVAAGVIAAMQIGKMPPTIATIRHELGLDLEESRRLLLLHGSVRNALNHYKEKT